jgi:hypothetical protein
MGGMARSRWIEGPLKISFSFNNVVNHHRQILIQQPINTWISLLSFLFSSSRPIRPVGAPKVPNARRQAGTEPPPPPPPLGSGGLRRRPSPLPEANP